jgi:hypothetical protein
MPTIIKKYQNEKDPNSIFYSSNLSYYPSAKVNTNQKNKVMTQMEDRLALKE